MLKKFIFCCVILIASSSNTLNAELIKNQIITIDSQKRTYDLFVPSKLPMGDMPLLVLLHGHGGNADVMTGQNGKPAPYKVWLSIAEREGWAVIIPDGEFGSDKRRGWNDCRSNASTNPETDDVKFLNALVDRVSNEYPINTGRIYAHGTSNGGNMVFRLAQESTKYRAIAAVVASMPEESECAESSRPISVLVMNGTDDRILPYEGGQIAKKNTPNKERGSVLSTAETIMYWIDRNETNARPKISVLDNINRRDRSRVRVERYSQGKNNSEVILYKVIRGGHTEPSLTEHYRRLFKRIAGRQNKDIEMAEEVWKFFERNR